VRKPPQLHDKLDGHKRKQNLEPASHLDHCSEALDFVLMSRQQARGEHVAPEGAAFAEGDLELNGVGVVALAREHGHGVVEDAAGH